MRQIVMYTRGRLTRAHYAQTQTRLRPRAQVANLSYDEFMTLIFAPRILRTQENSGIQYETRRCNSMTL